LVLTGALFAEQPGLGKSPQVFRASINTVTVDVSVFEGSTPVVGLSASDFLLWDNDVRQLANVVSAGAIPLDVTLLLETTAITPARVAAFNARMQKMVEQLRSTDRVRLLTIDSYVDELVPIGPPALPMRPAKAGGSAASVYDALALSLMRRSEPGRRHLIVAFTREYDLRSAATAAMVIEIAKRSDAVLHIVEIDRDELPIGRTVESRFRPDVNGRASLVTAAETTGGAFHERAVFRDRMVDAFVKILTEFGQGYVLQFNLNGVARPGLHTIRVEVPSRRKVTVRARRTYVIEEPARGR
jgi:hypothetical protein